MRDKQGETLKIQAIANLMFQSDIGTKTPDEVQTLHFTKLILNYVIKFEQSKEYKNNDG